MLRAYQVGVAQPLALGPRRYLRHLRLGVQWAGVVTAREFGDVAVQVLLAHVVVHPVIAPLQGRPERLHPVRVRLPPDVLAHAVPDGLMRPGHPDIGQGLVGVDGCGLVGVLEDEALERWRIGLLHHLGRDLAGLPVLHPHDRRFAHWPASGVEFLASVLVLLQPADVGLVRLHGA